MRKSICIMCESSIVNDVRNMVKTRTRNIMTIGLSESGSEPATHWFCKLSVNDEGYDTIMEYASKFKSSKGSIEEIGEDEFLKKYNLKRI